MSSTDSPRPGGAGTRTGRTGGAWALRAGAALARGGLRVAAVAVLIAALLWLVAPAACFSSWSEASAALAGLTAQSPPPLASRQRRLAALALAAQEDRRLSERTLGPWTAPVDPRACGRALARNLRAGAVREGCSTIPMQLAGFALDEVAPVGRTLAGKLFQVRLSLRLATLPPDHLLQLYLANLPCGTDLTRGLDGCALLHFGRRPEALTDAEVVLLATAVQAPSRDLADPDRARDRVVRAAGLLSTLGWVDAGTAAAIAGGPLGLDGLHPDLVRAWARGLDLGWTSLLRAALDRVGAEPDLVRVGAVLRDDGTLLASAGPSTWLDVPLEAGSWMKPWCAETAASIPGVGPGYLAEAGIPRRLPLFDDLLRPYRPRNVGADLPALATPAAWVTRSTNSATIAAWVAAPLWAPPAERDAWLQRWVDPADVLRWSTPRDWRATQAFVEAWTGTEVTDTTPLPGFRVLAAAAARSCATRVAADVPGFDPTGAGLATLLGTGRATLRAWGQGFAHLWLPGGEPSAVARLLREASAEGTLSRLARTTPGGLLGKTATARRSVGLAMVVPTSREGHVVVLFAAARPSGAPIAPHTSGLLVPAAEHLLDATWPNRASLAQELP